MTAHEVGAVGELVGDAPPDVPVAAARPDADQTAVPATGLAQVLTARTTDVPHPVPGQG